jgi:hypothetical protein
MDNYVFDLAKALKESKYGRWISTIR